MAHRTKINLGVIGAGMIADTHMKNACADTRCSVAWLADINPAALKKLSAAHGVKNSSADYHDMLADSSLDAVLICTPPFTHKKIFMDCVKSGKHVMVEKPFAISRPEMRTMLAAAQRRPRQIIMEASARHARISPKFAFAKKMIDSGKLGDVYYIHHRAVARRARPGVEYHPSAKWFLDRSRAGGGPSMDWGVYDLSFLLGLVSDKPVLSSIISGHHNIIDPFPHKAPVFNVEEHAWSLMKCNTGLDIYWERASNAHMNEPSTTCIYGTRAGMRLHYCTWEPNTVEIFDIAGSGAGKPRTKTIAVPMRGHDDHAAFMRHFIDVLAGKSQPALTLPVAAKHLDIIFRMFDD